jgi:hypothetical protein
VVLTNNKTLPSVCIGHEVPRMEEDSLVERGDLAPPGLFLALYPVSLLRKCNSYFSMNLVYLYMPRTVPTYL